MSDLGTKGVKLAKMGQIWDFFRSDLITFGSSSQQAWQSWRNIATDLDGLQMRKIWDVLRSVFSIFWLVEPKCTETDLRKSQMCPFWANLT